MTTSNPQIFAGEVVFITGAGIGICRATAAPFRTLATRPTALVP